MIHSTALIADKIITCWEWHKAVMKETTLAAPDDALYLWEAITGLGYRSIAKYDGAGGMRTYLYTQFDVKYRPTYLALTVLSADHEPRRDDTAFGAEIVLLPTWPDVLGYLRMALPVILPAQESDGDWDHGE